MSILTVNLKHLYQQRSVWLFYGMFLFVIWLLTKGGLPDRKKAFSWAI